MNTTCWHNWAGDCPAWKTDRHGCRKPEDHIMGRNTRTEEGIMKHTHVCKCGHMKKGHRE